MKPDWEKAPPWAKYLAMDGNGAWHWFSERPDSFNVTETWVESFDGGRKRVRARLPADCGWQTSIEERPKVEGWMLAKGDAP